MRKLQMPHIQITHEALMLYSRGPKELTMRALGKALGVCASALYRHFRNKDAIIGAVAAAAETRLAFAMRPSARLAAPEDRVRFMAERAMIFSGEQPHLFRLVTRRKGDGFSGRAEDRADLMREQLDQAMREKRLKKTDLGGLCTAVWAQLCGLVALRERGDLPAGGFPLRDAWLGTTQRMLQGIRAA